ncbi:MAG: VIT1/CCC1 transporter family protein [Armatimonadota bacterium]
MANKEGPHKLSGGVESEKGLAGVIRELVFGAEDGLVSILGLVTGVAAGTTNPAIVLLAGVSGALSGAISMAAGNYLGVKSDIEVMQSRIEEEKASIEANPETERVELADFYLEHGMTPEEVDTIVPATERNTDLMIKEMAAHELGISPAQLQNPVWKGVWIFIAYILASVIPVLPYALFDRNIAFRVSILGTIIALFGVGAAKTVYTKRNPVKSGLEMLIIAALAGIAGYIAGHFAPV